MNGHRKMETHPDLDGRIGIRETRNGHPWGLSDRASKLVALILILLSIYSTSALAQEIKLGDVSDGNRSIPVHLIDLYDEEGSLIRPGMERMLPFSTKQTCLPCHDYRKISSGWHFNAAKPNVPAGRRGEPWILVDRITATQLPLSYRDWAGTYHPDELNITPMQFIQLFGRHMPGGSIGDDEEMQAAENVMRWWVSGKLEVNCLSCHDAERGHDQAEFGTQTRKQNFRWAASATSGFASVRGAARDMPDNYSVYGSLLDVGRKIPPSVTYDETRFNAQGKVLFDIVREVPNERCYFCHSTKVITGGSERWEFDEDVHLMAGMKCVDCHRNGLDHAMIRGYEGEAEEYDKPVAATFTCKGCHLGEENSKKPSSGRLGAPVPKHAGIPLIHFRKLTCTACHSGPWPDENAYNVKTSRAHALGTHVVNRSDEALPHIVAPVFVEQKDGKIAPHKMFWPSFWAKIKADGVQPINPTVVWPIAANLVERDTLATGDWPNLTEQQIVGIMRGLVKNDSALTPAYVGGGQLYRLTESGELIAEDHPAAKPYSWAFAHDVRPATQSLGIRGCGDCHAIDSPFYFAQIGIDTPVTAGKGAAKKMVDFQKVSTFYARLFSLSFVFRPWLKLIALLSTAVLALILVVYLFKGFAVLVQASDGSK
ncbi:MAG: hypothetical protein ACE5HO_15780 [bacterium]